MMLFTQGNCMVSKDKIVKLFILGLAVMFLFVTGSFAAENENTTTPQEVVPQTSMAAKKIYVQSLHLYVLLNEFRDFIAQQILIDQPEEKKRDVLVALGMVEEAIKKMHDIVDALNSEVFYSQDSRYQNLEIL